MKENHLQPKTIESSAGFLHSFLVFFSARFSFFVLAGFFLVSFFLSMPLDILLSFSLTISGADRDDPTACVRCAVR